LRRWEKVGGPSVGLARTLLSFTQAQVDS